MFIRFFVHARSGGFPGYLGGLLLFMLGSHASWAGDPPQFSWQNPQAKVLATGDLQWDPKPFVFEKGASLKYIDFDAGNDSNPGTKDRPWKHHPWDANATGQAKEGKGIQTYVFKRGVIYRGSLVAAESGQPNNPIRLTSDPAWGAGEAALYGSTKITGGWKKCTAADAPPTMPEPEKVWFLELGKEFTPECVFETRGDQIFRIHIARTPNYKLTNPDDPMGDNYEWTGPAQYSVVNEDRVHLTQPDPHFYEGAQVWSEWQDEVGNMGLPYRSPAGAYKPAAHSISRKKNSVFGYATPGQRYYLENLPAFLDAPGEFYCADKGKYAGRLYLRLPEDRDPNRSTLELGREIRLINILDRHDIAITGLRFSFLNVPYSISETLAVFYRPTAIGLIGDCRNIRVANCNFLHVPCAVRAGTRVTRGALQNRAPHLVVERTTPDFMDQIVITDCDITHADEGGILIEDGYTWWIKKPDAGTLGAVSILRNRVTDAVFRSGGDTFFGPAIGVTDGQLTEIAGNIVDTTWGVGIWLLAGKWGYDIRDIPLIHALVHHNKVVNSLLSNNDWGGIAVWQGSAYVFNNISGNPMGPKRNVAIQPNGGKSNFSCNGFAYYMDGLYKGYMFNNIAWGKRNDPNEWLKNRSAFMMAAPHFMNNWFNNTAYKFTNACTGSGGQRTSFIGNIFDDITTRYFNQNSPGDISLYGSAVEKQVTAPAVSTVAYSANVFFGVPTDFGRTTDNKLVKTLDEYRAALEAFKPLAGDVGVMARENPLVAPEKGDFRPKPNSAASGRGAHFFVPWRLYMTVGEWSFCRYNANPQTVIGENMFMSDEYIVREMYYDIPRNDLSVPGAKAEDYVKGLLEDWTEGALVFNGKDRYAVFPDKALKGDYPISMAYSEDEKGTPKWNKGHFTYPGSKRRTVDMDTNNFLLELFFKTVPRQVNGTLVAKCDDKAGYALTINAQGNPSLTLRGGAGAPLVTAATVAVNDGQWHHLIVEVDRKLAQVAFYVDGKSTPPVKLNLAADVSLANSGDFLVGKSASAAAPEFFAGTLDFLRVCRGTLADARTTIEELYAWEFEGPAMRDFTGRLIPAGTKRDAGAIQSSR